MSDTVKGMVVYHRTTKERGVVTASNQYTGKIAVKFDNGNKEVLDVANLMSEKLYNEFKQQERFTQMGIKKEDCTIHQTVFQVGNAAPLARGKIAGPLVGNLIIVEWDNGSLAKVDIKTLMNEIHGIAENKRLVDEKEKLEREFEKAEEIIAEKIKEASKLINEAVRVASAKGLDITDMWDATSPLRNAIDKMGWSSSSLSC